MEHLVAKLNLAWNLLLYLLKRPFTWKKRGYQQFVQNYRSDRLIPLSQTDKDWVLRFSQCFNCGLCDTVCPALWKLPREKFPGPSLIVTTLARATPDFWAVDLDFSLCEGCDLCERVCPNHVPIKEALEFIEVKAQENMAWS